MLKYGTIDIILIIKLGNLKDLCRLNSPVLLLKCRIRVQKKDSTHIRCIVMAIFMMAIMVGIIESVSPELIF